MIIILQTCRLHTSRMSLGSDVDLEEFITMKDDLSGADIKAVCTEAGLLALRERRMRVTKQDFASAREKVCLGLCQPLLNLTSLYRCSTGKMRAHQRACTCRLILMFLHCTEYQYHIFVLPLSQYSILSHILFWLAGLETSINGRVRFLCE
jgi:hypothetical protein